MNLRFSAMRPAVLAAPQRSVRFGNENEQNSTAPNDGMTLVKLLFPGDGIELHDAPGFTPGQQIPFPDGSYEKPNPQTNEVADVKV